MPYHSAEALGLTDKELADSKAYFDALEAKKKAAAGGGFWGAVSNIFGGAASAYGAGLAQQGQQPGVTYAPRKSAIETYLPYIVIGGAVIAVVVILKKKK